MAVARAALFNAAVMGNVTYLERVSLAGGRILDLRFCTGNTVLHTHVGMAKTEARPEFLRYVLQEDADELLSVVNDNGDLVHHIAALCGQVKAIEVLLQFGGPFYLTVPNFNGRNPIQLAFDHISSIDRVISLVQVVINADPTKSYIPVLFDECILLHAVQTNSCDLVDLVYSVSSCRSRKPFDAAIAYGYTDVVKTILNHIPDLANSTDDDERTPHHLAAKDKEVSTLKMFLEQRREAAYCQDNRGLTVAHTAAQHNNVAALKLLMNCAPDSFSLKDDQLRNAAHHAALSEGGLDALVYIFEQDILFPLLCDVDQQENTPIHLLASRLHTVAAASFGHLTQNIIPKLHNLNLKRTNSEGLTPGDIVCSSNSDRSNPAKQVVLKKFKNAAPPSKDIAYVTLPVTLNDQDILKMTEKKKAKLKKIFHRNATIIAVVLTLSFSGILGPPGGFNQNDKYPINRGTPMLSDTTAFEVFRFFNMVSWSSSVTVAALYIIIIFSNLSIFYLRYMYYTTLSTSAISIISLVVAFAASTCATEHKSGPLLTVKLAVLSAFCGIVVFMYFFVLWGKINHKEYMLPISLYDKDD